MKKPRSAASSSQPTRLRSATSSDEPRDIGGGRTPASGTPRRPREVKAGGGARIIAPIALVVVAIACFGVITSSGNDDKASNSGAAAAEKSGESENGGGAVENKSEPTRSTYRVKAGDSFSAIAEKVGVDANTLTELNPDIDPRALQPGQKLKLK